MSTGSPDGLPNGPLVLARPTSFDGSPNTGSPNEYWLAQPRLMACPASIPSAPPAPPGKLHDVVKLMANCLEQKGTMRAMSRGDYDGLVAANEPPAPEFSATGFDFQSHLIKLDTTF